ncbi:MAG: hypothetical protein R3E68_03075 [Burkholderiaceae bacterium]
MKINDTPVRHALRPTMISAGLLTALGLCLAGYGVYVYMVSKSDRDEIVRATNHTRAQLSQKQFDLQQARDYRARYDALHASGVIGPFAKTDSLDRFEALVKAHPVPLRTYAMGGRLPANVSNPMAFQRYVPSRHEMIFEAEPLHEQALISLTNQLENALPGLTALESCSITRAEANAIGNLETLRLPRLTARCKINWYVFARNEAAASSAPIEHGAY